MPLLVALVIGILIIYTLLHYILFLLATHPRHASDIGHELNEFERRQLVQWVPKAADFLSTMMNIVRTTMSSGRIAVSLTTTAPAFSLERFSLIPIWPMPRCSNCEMACGCWISDVDRERPLTISTVGIGLRSCA